MGGGGAKMPASFQQQLLSVLYSIQTASSDNSPSPSAWTKCSKLQGQGQSSITTKTSISIEVLKQKGCLPVSHPPQTFRTQTSPALSDTEWCTPCLRRTEDKSILCRMPSIKDLGIQYEYGVLIFIFFFQCLHNFFFASVFVYLLRREVKVFLLQPLECGYYTHPLHTHRFVLMFSNSLISVFPNILCSYRPTQL